jgi:hypothetical protein
MKERQHGSDAVSDSERTHAFDVDSGTHGHHHTGHVRAGDLGFRDNP